MTAQVRVILDGEWVTYTRPRTPAPPFVPGVTEPFYFEATNIDEAQTNIGNRATRSEGVALTTYTGTITNGIAQLSDGGTYENILFPCVVDLRNGEQLINCRVVVPTTYTAADSINGCVRILNGGTNTGALLQNVEIHNRAQRPLNGVVGRNAEIRETVVTGCIDGFVESTGGSAPQNWGFNIYDSCQPTTAWWYTPTVNGIIHPSDTQSHNDGYQSTSASLRSEIYNTVFNGYLSEIIGTGTPGAGSDAGNPYVPASGYNFIATQATQNSWKASFGTYMTNAGTSKYGVSHRLPGPGAVGSVASLMINRENVLADGCYFAGGIAQVNLLDSNLSTTMNVTIRNCHFWNDMKNPTGRGTAKGHAILITSGKSATFSGNTWNDGTAVSPTSV